MKRALDVATKFVAGMLIACVSGAAMIGLIDSIMK